VPEQIGKEPCLIERDHVVPWKGLIALIKRTLRGSPDVSVDGGAACTADANGSGHSHPALEQAPYETTILACEDSGRRIFSQSQTVR
jgi:hypothetical protein